MELANLERERVRVYKAYLRQEAQKNARARKEQNNYQRKREQANINELVGKLNEDDLRRLEERKNMAILLKEHNSQLTELKRSGANSGEPAPAVQRSGSFLDRINKQDAQRIWRNKQTHAGFTQENEAQEHARREVEERARWAEKEEEQKHMRRLKQMWQNSQKNYEDIKRKHEQDMRIYDMHSSLIHENEQYRRLAQKFTDCEVDIISKLKRNESAERKRIYRNNQEILKLQMDQSSQRKSLERSHILEGQDIDQSIFKKLMHGSPNYKKQYGEQLRSQISEMESRKSGEKTTLKQGQRIAGIYGGEQGRERHAQIQYIDRKMGLSPKMLKSTSIENEEQMQKPRQKLQPSYEVDQSRQKLESTRMRAEPVLNLPTVNSREESIQAEGSPSRMERDNIGRQRYGKEGSQQTRLYRSYDLVTGQSKFYG